MEEPEEYVFQARIAVTGARDSGPYNQFAFGGSLLAHKDQPLLTETGQWENIQCEIIIRPLKRIGESKHSNIRLDHAATSVGDDSQWVKPSKNKNDE